MTDDPDADFLAQWQTRPVTMPDCMVNIKGVAEPEAQRLGELVGGTVRELSRIIDLAGLDGITIAADYPAALLELDRGYLATQPLKPTTENGVGIAMAPSVLRNGLVKSHIVIDASVAFQLEQHQDADLNAWALYTVAHECAHVELNKIFDASFPGMLLRRRYKDYEDSIVGEFAGACWDEYAASRISAPFGEKQLPLYEQSFVTVLKSARERGNAAIRAFRLHGDITRLMTEIGPIYRQVLTFGLYVLGHLAGRGNDLSIATDTLTALKGHWYAPHFAKLSVELEKLWSRYGKWETLDEFAGIGQIAKDVMREAGADIQRKPDGTIYISVPFTLETMPQ